MDRVVFELELDRAARRATSPLDLQSNPAGALVGEPLSQRPCQTPVRARPRVWNLHRTLVFPAKRGFEGHSGNRPGVRAGLPIRLNFGQPLRAEFRSCVSLGVEGGQLRGPDSLGGRADGLRGTRATKDGQAGGGVAPETLGNGLQVGSGGVAMQPIPAVTPPVHTRTSDRISAASLAQMTRYAKPKPRPGRGAGPLGRRRRRGQPRAVARLRPLRTGRGIPGRPLRQGGDPAAGHPNCRSLAEMGLVVPGAVARSSEAPHFCCQAVTEGRTVSSSCWWCIGGRIRKIRD